MTKILPVIFLGFFLAGGAFTSCKKDPVSPKTCDTCSTDTSHHHCDTCNINKDSLTHVRDSLAHVFVWKEYLNAIPGDADNHFSGVWVFGPNDIYIVGASLSHFDGTNFTIIPAIDATHHVLLSGGLSGDQIFAFSKTDFWITAYGGEALHTEDGLNFQDFRFGGVNASWGTKSTDMFFVSNGGSIYHYDGTKFDTMKSNTTKDLHSVWGTSHNDVWACGANPQTGETTILHFDGTNWSEDKLSQTTTALRSGLFATWACDSAGHKFVATSGSNVYRKTDNGLWRNDSGSIPNALGGDSYVGLELLSGNSAADLMAAGGWGWVGHWNGKTWKKYDALYDYNNATIHHFNYP